MKRWILAAVLVLLPFLGEVLVLVPCLGAVQTPLDELQAIIVEMNALATTQTNKGRMMDLQRRADVILKIQQGADTWNSTVLTELAAIKAELVLVKALVTPTGMPPMPTVPPAVPPPVVVPPVVIPPVVVPPVPPVKPPAGLPTRLHTIADLVFRGIYQNPPSTVAGNNYYSQEFAGRGLAFNPARKSLFATCHVSGGLVGEISIPATFGTTATFLQPCADPVDGLKRFIMSDSLEGTPIVVGGLLAWKNGLIVTEYDTYDANGAANKSHFVSGVNLGLPSDVKGPYTLEAQHAGFVGGYMTHVPLAWQAAIGAPALTGLCCISVIGRSNFGPGFSAFNPDDLGVKNPVPTIPLVVYPAQLCTGTPPPKGCLHQFIKPDGSNPYFNWVSRVTGIVWPANSRSIFLFGGHGNGKGCYGPSTTDPALVGTIYGSNPAERCFDLVGFDGASFEQHSFHAYPYVNYVWVFDALDLLAVRAGTKQPEDVIPVEVGILRQLCGATTPCTDEAAATYPNNMIRGATSDPATGKIYLERPGAVVEFTLTP